MLELSPDTQEMNAGEMEYLLVETGGWPARVHVQLDAIDAIARDLEDDPAAQGLLLGRVAAVHGDLQHSEVWIEQYRRGLDTRGEDGWLFHPVGAYVSGGKTLTGVDGLVLKILASEHGLLGQFFVEDEAGFFEARGGDFEFRGRLQMAALPEASLPEAALPKASLPEAALPKASLQEVSARGTAAEPERSPTSRSGFSRPGISEPVPEPVPMPHEPGEAPPAPAPKNPRLVADFGPPQQQRFPAMFQSLDSPSNEERSALAEDHETHRVSRVPWKPLAAALALLAVVLGLVFLPWRNGPAAPAAGIPDAEPFRPLGLYVDAAGPEWRATWNQNATPLSQARSVGLFVREGDDQNRIDLTPEELKAGTYRFKPAGNDVTVRLEVMDVGGRVSAESFRVLRTPAVAANPPSVKPAAPAEPVARAPEKTAPRIVEPKAVRRVPPVISPAMRARIRKSVTMDVTVKVDTRGKVISAKPVGKQSGLNAYLAERAVAAAREWRFTPARQNGKAVAGTQTIRFVFDRG